MGTHIINRILVLGPLAVVLALPEAAHAQSADADNSTILEKIIVTARRRTEAAQDTPVSLTVLQANEIAAGKTSSLEDLSFRAPNVNYNGQGGPFTIRGVGNLGIAGGVDRQPAVGLFLDDVFLARPIGYPTMLEDLERVEVVRGSQSLLYGKNTIGGAVNVISRLPGQDRSAEFSATLGNDFDRRLRAAFETPIAGTAFGVRGAIAWKAQDGYIRNLADGKDVSDTDQFAGRVALAGDIGEATRLRIIADYSRDGSDGGLWYAPLPLAFDRKAIHDFAPENDVRSGGISARIDHDFENFSMASITAYRGHEMDSALDGDFTAAPFIVQGQVEDQRQFSQELRFNSRLDGPWRWGAGLYYMHESFDAAQFFDLASLPRDLWSRNTFNQKSDSFSGFAEAGYFITPELELSGGARASYDRKRTVSEISSPSGTFMFGMPGKADAAASFTNISPEIAATWHFSEGNIAYAKISRGYKAGGMSPYIEADGSANRYNPEQTTTYEIGAKGTLLDDRLTLSAAAFWVDWKDQQAVIYTTPFTRVYRNAAAATSKGVELEAAWQMTTDLSVSAGYGYTHATYDDFVDPILGKNYTGNPLPFAPEHSVNLGARWQHPLQNGFLLNSGVDYSYRSSYSFTPDNAYRQAPTHLVDAFIGIERAGWSATLWGKNLTDERYLKNYFNYAGTDMGVAAAGRSFGITVASKW